MASESLPAGVVFDCDGTLADTEPIAARAWREALAEHGYEVTEDDLRAVMGQPYPRTFAHFAARVDLGDPQAFRPQVRDRFRRRLATDLRLYDDAVTTLRALVDHEVPVAVASSSSREHVGIVLELGRLTPLVQVVVGAEDVTRHKPDPEPYLAATAALGLPATACAAVEDTPVGVDAGVAAGLFTVAVVRELFDADQLGAAHRVVERLSLPDLRTRR